MKKLLITTAMTTSMVVGAPATAQVATNASTDVIAAPLQRDATAGADTGDVIIVTARRRAETLQSIPAAVSATSQETLTRAGATDLADVARLTPGLTFNAGNGGGLAAPSLRGVTNVTITTFDNNVGVFLDGVYLSAKSNLDIDLFNLSRVEVIKGPQSRPTIPAAGSRPQSEPTGSMKSRASFLCRSPNRSARWQLRPIPISVAQSIM